MPCEHCSWLPLQPKRIYDGAHATMGGAGGGVNEGEGLQQSCVSGPTGAGVAGE